MGEPDGRNDGREVAGLATREGYLAPVFLVMTFFASALRRSEMLGLMFFFSCWAGILLFAISGLRRGRRGARIAAGLVWMFLFGHTALGVVLLYH